MNTKQQKTAYLFILPAFVFLLVIFIYPLIYGIYLSLHSSRGGLENLKFVNLKNYVDVIASKMFWDGFLNTVIFAAGGVFLTIVLSFVLAILLNSVKRFNKLYRVLLLIPVGICPVVSGLTWRMIFNPASGIANWILTKLNLPALLWHTDITTAMLTVIIVESWQWYPIPFLIIYSGLQMLPEEPFEAAQIDGATFFQRIRYITLPLLRPIIIFAIMFRAIGTLRSFDIIYTVTKGGPARATETLVIQAYKQSFAFFDFETGLVIGTILFVVIMILSIFLIKMMIRSY